MRAREEERGSTNAWDWQRTVLGFKPGVRDRELAMSSAT